METEGKSHQLTAADDPPVKEILWPPHGHVYQQEFMLPAYCKPKLIPLKSVTLEKLEKMQSENAEKLRNFELEREAEQAQNGGQHDDGSNSVGGQSAVRTAISEGDKLKRAQQQAKESCRLMLLGTYFFLIWLCFYFPALMFRFTLVGYIVP